MKGQRQIRRTNLRAWGLGMAGAAVCVLAGCQASEADRQELQHGFALYSQRQLDESEAAATKFIDANPGAVNIDEAYYLRGISRLTRGGADNRRAASDDLQLAIQKSQRADLKAKAYRALGDISYDAQKWTEAQDRYQMALDTAPNAPVAATTILDYRIGACLQSTGNWAQAAPWFQRVVAANSDPFLNERAIARMRSTSFALQFGAFQERANANTLRDQLAAASVPAQIDTEFREKVLTYLVRYGSFHTYAEAEAARDRFLPRYPVVAVIP